MFFCKITEKCDFVTIAYFLLRKIARALARVKMFCYLCTLIVDFWIRLTFLRYERKRVYTARGADD